MQEKKNVYEKEKMMEEEEKEKEEEKEEEEEEFVMSEKNKQKDRRMKTIVNTRPWSRSRREGCKNNCRRINITTEEKKQIT